jgi:DNA-binding transcriptional LysR family regulator
MSDIETRLFRYFVALADERHFSRAAQRLKISPPTLTHQIKKLESQLGVRLVERKGNTHIEFTEAGQQFLARARNVLQQIQEAEVVAQQAARGQVGRIEIGYMPSVACFGQMQECLAIFQRANPAIEITLHKLSPMDQVAAIVRKTIDCGFLRCPYKYPTGLDGFIVYHQPMVLALPESHPLARHKKIDPEILKDEIFVNPPDELNVGFWGHTEAVAKLGNFTPRVAKRAHDMFTALTYVSIGYGIGVVSKSMTRINIPNVVYREFATKQPPASAAAFVYRRGDMSAATQLLMKFLRRHVPANIDTPPKAILVGGLQHVIEEVS